MNERIHSGKETEKSQFATETELDRLAAALKAEDQSTELELRPKLLSAWTGFKVSRWNLGEVLAQYQKLYKQYRRGNGQIKRFDAVLEAIGCERSRGYRILSDYQRASKVPQSLRLLAKSWGIDLAEAKYRPVAELLAATPKGDANATDEDRLASALKEAGKPKPLAPAFNANREVRSLVSRLQSHESNMVAMAETFVGRTIKASGISEGPEGDAAFIELLDGLVRRLAAARMLNLSVISSTNSIALKEVA